ncbi:hypothetical protein A8E20_34090, partial [Burkholderia cenocepacia]|uniref:hypothetical protein n=2 Tax=Burkholderia cenocepacia TaxID=95486 RepID=UPI000981E097
GPPRPRVRRPVSDTYDDSAKIERNGKDTRKAFVLFARKTRDSRGFLLIFNGSDSEKRHRLPILELTGLLVTGRTN